MQQRPLGTDGPAVSVVGLGCNNFGMAIDATGARAVVGAALDAGITHFDTAEGYGGGQSEEMLGAALGRRRDEVVIASKVLRRPQGVPWRPGDLARRIEEGCDTTLRRLGTDRVDVYYEHHRDPEAPVDEAVEALDGLVRAGKARFTGCSNYAPADIRRAAEVSAERGWTAPCAAQLHWNLLARQAEDELVPEARRAGMGVVPYYPLASGLLTGKYGAGGPYPAGSRFERLPRFSTVATPENIATVDRLAAVAESAGHTVGELAVAWLVAQPGVASVIVGATTPEQVRANARAASWCLDADELAAADRAAPR